MTVPTLSAPPPVAGLIVAAGRGARMGSPTPKQYLPLAGRPMLRRSIDALLAHPRVETVQVVISPEDAAAYDHAAQGLPTNRLAPPVYGGAQRQDSVRAGLEALGERAPAMVLIHDAARPGLPSAVIDRLLDALETHAAAVPALPVVDALLRGEGGVAAQAASREGLWRTQTPQAFHFDVILKAHRAFAGQSMADDAAVAAAAGAEVRLAAGAEENFKVTTPDDLARAAALFAPPAPPRVWRSGTGFDVHRFGPGDHVILCGVRIPHEAGLVGHSDADVGLHAITDALLGAVAEGDIGRHFPPSDPQWKGVDSAVFLRRAMEIIRAKGGWVGNIDLTLICERPKIAPHAAAMRIRTAEICDLPLNAVSVKATTSERLGFTGRGEGIAAMAAASVSLPEEQEP